MLINNNYIILLLILSFVIFYYYISSHENNFIEKLIQSSSNENTTLSKPIPVYSKKNYNDIVDINKKYIKGAVVQHDIFTKITLNDKILHELDAIVIPIISKLNSTLKTNYNKNYIDYKYIEKQTDKQQNSSYRIKLALFQRGVTQKELTLEIYKDSNKQITVNKIIDQSEIFKLNYDDKYNHSNIYMSDSKNNNLPTVPQCSQSYPSNSVDMNTIQKTNAIEHFGSRISDFDDIDSKNIRNKNIENISKYYNLTNQFVYPNIEEGLFTHDSTSKDNSDNLDGISTSDLTYDSINFKVNKYGVQDTSEIRNAWFVDKESEKGITKVYPKNKLTNKWDKTGTTIPESMKPCDIADGIDYACEIREKIPKFHPSSFAYYANNDFKNITNGSNMFSPVNTGGAAHTPI